MNLKLNKNMNKLTYHKYTLIIFTFIIINAQIVFSQNLDEDFINSLPDNIRDDVVGSIQKPSGVLQPTKEYGSFDSKITKINSSDIDKGLHKFGDKFFVNTPSTFMPINDPVSNSGYILDVDDEILIHMVGSRSDSYVYRIDRSGSIAIKDIGMLSLAGLSLESANRLINKILSDNFIETEAVISLSKVRDIEILITGQVNQPGVYILSGYSSLLHAIIMAGGISEHGTLRKIKIKRPYSEDKTVDLYELLVFANTESNVTLRSGDSIFVDSSQNFIPLIGGVAQPAIYEFLDGESVEDIIEFAGGLTKEASNQSKIVSRSSKGELFSFNADETSLVEKGDRIFVPFNKFKANDLLIDRDYQFLDDPVEISGAVSNPGLYYLDHSSKISNLILEAGGFTSDAYIFGGVLINKEAKLKESQYNKKLYDEAIKSLASISHSTKNTDISKLLPVLSEFKDTEASGRIISEFDIFKLKKNPTLDTSISPGDKIYIPYNSNVVHVFGEVLNTGSVTYSTGMKVSDYINASGGLNDAADKRRIILVQANGKAIRVNLRGNIFSSTSEEILPGAVIYVSRDMRNIEGLDLAMTISPIISSLAISLASINSINKN